MDFAEIGLRLNAAVEEHDFSGVIRLRRGNESIYQRAAGFADRANRIPNRLDTRFGIASGTKIFTALAIGKLIEAGKLSFDTRLADVVDLGFPQYAPDITIRHLLTHTSGIPDYYDEDKVEDFDGFKVSVPWSELKGPRDYLQVFPNEPMKFMPGERFSYSNGGFIVLGIVIEALTGIAYRDYVETEILRPVGMARSGYFAMNKLPEGTAFGYVEEDSGWRTNVFDLPIIGASDGGAFTTVEDISRLWDALWGFRILSEATLKVFATPYLRAETFGEGAFYGHGIWFQQTSDGSTYPFLTGCDAGVSFRSEYHPAENVEITVISNTTNGAWPIVDRIDALLGG
ncbi:MAG: beta-lactamase family protein [Anaerolineae bacterium]|nr:beta-lactamase family protein [Anaerolineae bacterium]